MIVHLRLAKLRKEWYGSNMTRLREVFMFPFALLLPFAGVTNVICGKFFTPLTYLTKN